MSTSIKLPVARRRSPGQRPGRGMRAPGPPRSCRILARTEAPSSGANASFKLPRPRRTEGGQAHARVFSLSRRQARSANRRSAIPSIARPPGARHAVATAYRVSDHPTRGAVVVSICRLDRMASRPDRRDAPQMSVSPGRTPSLRAADNELYDRGVIWSKPRRPFAGCPAPPMLPGPCPRFSAVSSRRCTSCCGLQQRSRKQARGPSRDAPRNARTPGCSSGPSACTTVMPTFKARWQTQSAHQQPLGRLLDARLSLPDLQVQSALAVRWAGGGYRTIRTSS